MSGLKLCQNQGASSSHQTYRGYIDNHIKPNIGDIPLGKLSSLHLQKLYKKLLAGGRVERIEAKGQSKGLSAKTVRNIRACLKNKYCTNRW